MNRRNVLIGIATIAMVTGAVLGSGALTSVQADRALNIEAVSDSDAYVGLEANSSLLGTSTGSNSEDVLNLSLDRLNDDANTTLAPAFNIHNTVGSEVTVEVNNVPSGVDVETSPGTSLATNPVTLSDGDSVDVNMIIDTTADIEGQNTITVVAETT